jgi:hypothetical protein
MASQFTVVYTVPSNGETVEAKLRLYGGSGSQDAPHQIDRIASYTDAIACGAYNGGLAITTDGVQASGTVTFTASVATDTVTVNGVTFTEVASGAGNNQFNHGTTDAITAANFAAAVNASTSLNASQAVKGTTTGTSVATITARIPGTMGNMGTLSTASGPRIVVSGANLTGGASDTEIRLTNGQNCLP